MFNRVQFAWNQVTLFPIPSSQPKTLIPGCVCIYLCILLLLGVEVVFNFTSGHNVNWVDKTTFDSCNNITDTTPVSGPITWTAPQVMIAQITGQPKNIHFYPGGWR